MARSRSPSVNTRGNRNNEMGELDEKLVDVWSKHIEPKLAQTHDDIKNVPIPVPHSYPLMGGPYIFNSSMS